ncbi:MAG: hypothetical protein ABJB01_05645 [Rudaea sp.]
MSEFEWRNGMRKLGGPVEPSRDLWPDIASRIATIPAQRRSRVPAFAVAATMLVACGAALFAWRLQTATIQTAPTVAAPLTARPVINVVDSDNPAPHKVLAAAAEDLNDAGESIQQALEQRPDAVFLVGLLNRTNSQRMRVLKQSYSG